MTIHKFKARFKGAILLTVACFAFTASAEYQKDTYSYDEKEPTAIEAQPYEQIDKKWQIDVTYEDQYQETFYVYEIADQQELVEEVALELELTEEEVSDILTYQQNDFSDQNTYTYSDSEKKETTQSSDDQDEIIMALLQVIILILMQNNDTGVDLSALLELI